ncbi:hypothetical protein DD873_08715 [Staphylococcus pseudintermedius]|nr:hypothetical protein DD873_08715 [Staphylococcus pseudintermedius]
MRNIGIKYYKMGLYTEKQFALFVKRGFVAEDEFKEANGWFVGYVETKDNTYYFATHLKGEDNANGEKAQQISERILKEMELI